MRTREILPAALLVAIAAAAAMGQWVESTEAGTTLTPERLDKLLREAKSQRMSMERDQVAVEIREGLLFDPDKIDAAVQALYAAPKNTWEDNAHRISQAFAMVDLRFGKAWNAAQKGDYAAAAKTLQSLISKRDTSYLAAARQFCYANALASAGNCEDAVDAYTDLVGAMPDRFSFAALALLRAAETYETMHRRYYAMSLYKAWVDSFGLLAPAEADRLMAKAQQIEAEYRDALGTLARKMGQAHERLAHTDSGRDTQKKQKEVIEMLDDLIAMAEEQSQGQGSGQCSKCGGKGCSQCRGTGQGSGKSGSGQGRGGQSGPARGIGVPSAPATASRLVGGTSPRPENLAQVRPSDPSDSWGLLPPEQQQKLLETFREGMPERYRDMIRDYYRKMAAER